MSDEQCGRVVGARSETKLTRLGGYWWKELMRSELTGFYVA